MVKGLFFVFVDKFVMDNFYIFGEIWIIYNGE